MADHIPRIVYGSVPTTIQFIYPPEGDPLGEIPKASNVTTLSANGQIQNNQKYVARFYSMKMFFVSETVKALFDTFFLDHGSLKMSFTFYPHSDVDTGLITVTLMDDEIAYKRDLPASDGFLYSFSMNLRELL